MRAFVGHAAGSAGAAAQGNPCRVELFDSEPASPPGASAHTLCRSWLSGAREAQARCWSGNGVPIRLCVHGLLCTGLSWQLHGRPVDAITMNGQRVEFSRGEHAAWAGLSTIESTPCDPPSWLLDFFPVSPLHCARAGGSDGYLVLEWPAGTPLQSLPPPGAALARHTRRALIVTCRDKSPQRVHAEPPSRDTPSTAESSSGAQCMADPSKGVDVQLRYFAPQYSAVEDSATGSAMRVLAGYWRERCGDALTAWQCSEGGGLLSSRLLAGRCWIGGQVRLESTT